MTSPCLLGTVRGADGRSANPERSNSHPEPTIKDLAIELDNRPGALVEMGEALGGAGVSIEGGGAWVVDGRGVAHFLFVDGRAARAALEKAGIRVTFVAALASCHMLWFLSIAAKRGFIIERYEDDAVGELSKNDDGRLAMKTIVLRPAVTFGEGQSPARAELEALHHEAHDACYLSNSVRTEIQVAPVWRDE